MYIVEHIGWVSNLNKRFNRNLVNLQISVEVLGYTNMKLCSLFHLPVQQSQFFSNFSPSSPSKTLKTEIMQPVAAELGLLVVVSSGGRAIVATSLNRSKVCPVVQRVCWGSNFFRETARQLQKNSLGSVWFLLIRQQDMKGNSAVKL